MIKRAELEHDIDKKLHRSGHIRQALVGLGLLAGLVNGSFTTDENVPEIVSGLSVDGAAFISAIVERKRTVSKIKTSIDDYAAANFGNLEDKMIKTTLVIDGAGLSVAKEEDPDADDTWAHGSNENLIGAFAVPSAWMAGYFVASQIKVEYSFPVTVLSTVAAGFSIGFMYADAEWRSNLTKAFHEQLDNIDGGLPSID